jgi:hypothetical protein
MLYESSQTLRATDPDQQLRNPSRAETLGAGLRNGLAADTEKDPAVTR